MKRQIFFMLLAALALPACATQTRIVRDEKLTFELAKETPAEQDRDGLTVTVRMFGPAEADKDPTAFKNATMDIVQNGAASKQPLGVRLLPAPFFKVTIRNHTQFALKLDRAIIRVKDEAGNDYPVLSKRELQERLTNYLAGRKSIYAAQNVGITFPVDQLVGEYRSMRLLSRDTEIGPEDSSTYYLALDFPDDQYEASKLTAWSKRAGALKLQLYQIPVQTDAAGNVVKATKFEFNVKSKVDVTERTEEYKTLF